MQSLQLDEIFQNCFYQLWGDNDQRILYKEVAVERVGKANLDVTKWVIASGSPFYKAYDRYLSCRVSRPQMIKFVNQLKPNKKLSATAMKAFFAQVETWKQLPLNELCKVVEKKGMTIVERSTLAKCFEQTLMNNKLTTFLAGCWGSLMCQGTSASCATWWRARLVSTSPC